MERQLNAVEHVTDRCAVFYTDAGCVRPPCLRVSCSIFRILVLQPHHKEKAGQVPLSEFRCLVRASQAHLFPVLKSPSLLDIPVSTLHTHTILLSVVVLDTFPFNNIHTNNTSTHDPRWLFFPTAHISRARNGRTTGFNKHSLVI